MKYDQSKTLELNKDLWLECLKKTNLNLMDDEITTALENSHFISQNKINIKEFKDNFYQVLKLIRKSRALYRLSELS